MIDRINNFFYGGPETQNDRKTIARLEKHPHLGDSNQLILNAATSRIRTFDRRQFLAKAAGAATLLATVATPTGYFLLTRNVESEPTRSLEDQFATELGHSVNVELDPQFTQEEAAKIRSYSQEALVFIADLQHEAGVNVWNKAVNKIAFRKIQGDRSIALNSRSPDGQTYYIYFDRMSLLRKSTHVNELVNLIKNPPGSGSVDYIADSISTIISLIHEQEFGPSLLYENEITWRNSVEKKVGVITLPNQRYDFLTSNYIFFANKFPNSFDNLWLLEGLNMEAAMEIERGYNGDLKKIVNDYLHIVDDPTKVSNQFNSNLLRLKERKIYSQESTLPEETTEILVADARRLESSGNKVVVIKRLVLTPSGDIGKLPQDVKITITDASGKTFEMQDRFLRTSPNQPFEEVTITGSANSSLAGMTIETNQQKTTVIR